MKPIMARLRRLELAAKKAGNDLAAQGQVFIRYQRFQQTLPAGCLLVWREGRYHSTELHDRMWALGQKLRPAMLVAFKAFQKELAVNAELEAELDDIDRELAEAELEGVRT